ncbi:MAG: FAD-dependent oxidoreductase [Candidatus Helarchaeota archaeon]
MKQFDLIIVGGGAVGFSAAMKANALKAKTLMINNDFIGLGGTCVNVGCLPTKHLLHITELIHYAQNQNFEGLNFSTSFNFETIFEKKDELITNLREEKYEKVLKNLETVYFLKEMPNLFQRMKLKSTERFLQLRNLLLQQDLPPSYPQLKELIE